MTCVFAHCTRTHSDTRAQPGIHLLNITPYCVDPRVQHAETNRNRDPSFRSFPLPRISYICVCVFPRETTYLFLQNNFPENLFRSVASQNLQTTNRLFRITRQTKALRRNQVIFYWTIIVLEVIAHRGTFRDMLSTYTSLFPGRSTRFTATQSFVERG